MSRLHAPDTTLVDLAAFESALAELATVNAKIEEASSIATRRIATIKDELSRTTAPHVDRRIVLLRQLEDFATAHRTQHWKGQSRAFTAGKVGWRKATALAVEDDRTTLLALVERGLWDAIKVTESVSKPVLKAMAPETIAAVGARLETVERFFVELAKASPPAERIVAKPGPGGAA